MRRPQAALDTPSAPPEAKISRRRRSISSAARRTVSGRMNACRAKRKAAKLEKAQQLNNNQRVSPP